MYLKITKIIAIALMTIPQLLLAQQQYFVFKYNKEYGLTKLDGTTLIEDGFISHNNQVNEYALFEDRNKKQILIHLETGRKDTFDKFEGNSLFLENQYFANVEQQGKHFLWSQKTGERLPVPKVLENQSFHNVYMINKDFLYAVTYEMVYPPKAKPIKKTPSKTKVPAIQPPERLDPPKQITYVYIFKNERTMPVLSKIEVDQNKLFEGKDVTSMFNFYNMTKRPKNLKEDNSAQISILSQRTWNPEVRPWHFYYDSSFDVACIRVEDSIRVLDKNFKLLKTIAYTGRMEKDDVANFLKSQYPNNEVSLSYADFSPSVSMGSLTRKSFWETQKKESKYEISYLKDDNYIPYLRIEAAEARVNYNDYLFIKDNANNELMVQLDKKTLQLPIPIKYKKQFKIEEQATTP